MCLEYYPECGDGGDGCCQRHLNVSRSLAELTFSARLPSANLELPCISMSKAILIAISTIWSG